MQLFKVLQKKQLSLHIIQHHHSQMQKQQLYKRWIMNIVCAILHGLKTCAHKVDSETNGEVGYIYVPSTGIDGQN